MPLPTRTSLALSLSLALAAPMSLRAAEPPASGQAAPDADAVKLAPVVVTATKQGTAEQVTPASVTVIDGLAVERDGLDGLFDVAFRSPNVYFTSFTQNTPSITIRGLGFSDDESDSTSTSALIDGVPMTITTLGQLFDLEQIEVLRGPQSTLYGQNSMGGLVALRTRDPGFEFGGNAQLEYATGNRRRETAAMDIPLSDRTAIRIAGGAENADGYIKNDALDRDNTGGWRSRFGRIKFLHVDDAGGQWRLGVHGVNTKGGNDFFTTRNLADDHRSANGDAGQNDLSYTLVTGSYDRAFANGNRLAVNLGASRVDWDYWLPESVFNGPSGFNASTEQYSGEARLSHTPAGDVGLDWMGGIYASKIRRDSPYTFEMPGVFSSVTSARIKGSTAAIFGEMGWRFNPRWRVAGALRVERDERRMDWSSTQSSGPYRSVETLNTKTHDTVLLPRLTVEYRPDEQQFAWATVARGYKASGFNQFATDRASAADAYQPEYGNYAELGYRLQGQDESWSVGAVGFYTKLRDQQVVTIGSGGQSLTTNAGRSHNLGMELTGTWRPVRSVDLTAFVGLVKAVYDDYSTGGVDYAGQQFPNTPRQSYGVTAAWRFAPGWEAGLAVRHQASSNLYPTTTIKNDAYTLLDAQLTYRVDRHWTVGVYGKNLTDRVYYTRALNDLVVAGTGRVVGLRVGLDF
ncbi:TonB-dependent receptor [Achromobacter seleniivolatilans]|uniref:TonB-dependent receptor n=1 Tax=Achromobacter seleniivolatilans TaxID=3047478 RepID=A0ABY9M5I1_9BURK|nr:TonB-dependent receptor [Achromobacter sp. R39]WMD22246.1 TonB-dependent receptor [Achromobacter sp. R39]